MNIERSTLTRRAALQLGATTALAAVLVACGGDDDSTPASTTSAPTTTGAGTTVGSTATSAPAATAATRTVDTLHGAVEIPVAPQRIVCLGFVDTATLLDLGVTPVGMSTSGVNFLPEYESIMADIPEVISDAGELNLELIASLAPDVIIGADWLTPEEQLAPYDDLSAIAPTALCEWQQAAGNWPEQAEFFADIVGKTDELATLRTGYEAQADGIASDHAATLAATKWALVQGGGDVWYLYTEASSHGQVFARAGVQFADVATGEGTGFVELSTERLGDLSSADAIALNMNESAAAGGEALQAEPLFQALPAATAGQVYPMTWFFPSSYRVAEALLGELDAALGQLA